jgi:hypothetical protein
LIRPVCAALLRWAGRSAALVGLRNCAGGLDRIAAALALPLYDALCADVELRFWGRVAQIEARRNFEANTAANGGIHGQPDRFGIKTARPAFFGAGSIIRASCCSSILWLQTDDSASRRAASFSART